MSIRSFPDGFHAASLAEILGHPLELDHLRKTLFIEIDAHLHRFIQEKTSVLRAEYTKHLYGKTNGLLLDERDVFFEE